MMKTRLSPITRAGLALTAALALASTAQAAPDLPAELPPFGKDKPLVVPKITQTTLPNGLQVWVVPRNGIPRVDYVLAVRGAGLGADAPDAPGRAKLLAGLLSEGTASRSSRQIAEAAQAMGGGVGASASNDGIRLSANALASHAADMMKLLADVARRPAFPDGEVQLAKANALQGLKAAGAQPPSAPPRRWTAPSTATTPTAARRRPKRPSPPSRPKACVPSMRAASARTARCSSSPAVSTPPAPPNSPARRSVTGRPRASRCPSSRRRRPPCRCSACCWNARAAYRPRCDWVAPACRPAATSRWPCA